MSGQFIWGALTMACAVAGLFFARFYRASRDRLFLSFAVSFWVLGLHWLLLALVQPANEGRHQLYLLRLAAFVILIAGIADRNRRP
jgi:hypothetical protein